MDPKELAEQRTKFWAIDAVKEDLERLFNGGVSDARIARHFMNALGAGKYKGFTAALAISADTVARARLVLGDKFSRRYQGANDASRTHQRDVKENPAPPRGKVNEPPDVEPFRFPDNSLVTLATLDEHMCQFPHGDPKDKDFHYCGQPTFDTYCEAHAAFIAERKPKKRPVAAKSTGFRRRTSRLLEEEDHDHDVESLIK